MFENFGDNRKLSPNDGGDSGAGGEIILNGIIDASKTTPPPVPPVIPGTPPSTPPPVPPPSLSPIDDKVDVLTKSVLSSKYTDLNTVRLNATGDVVNLEGTVLVSKVDLDKSITDLKTERATKASEYIKTLGEVDVAGIKYKVNEDGSIKDTNGTVILSKEQLLDQVMATDDYLKEPTEYTSIYEEAEAITGIQLVDDQGNVLEFEETPEGLAMRDLHIAKQEGTRIAQETITNFFTTYPEIEDAYYYYKVNGNLNGFGQQTNHEGITLDKTNDEQHRDLVVEAEMMRGHSKEQALKRADLFKKNDLLYEEATDALKFMIGKEKLEKDNRRAKFESDQATIVEEQTKYWNNIASKVNSGKILDYNIPENIRVPQTDGTIRYATKQEFFNYMSKPIKNGLTQAQLDAQSEPIDVKIFNDYLRFVGNNMSYIVDQRVKQSTVNNFKERFTRDTIPKATFKVGVASAKSSNDKIQF